MDTAHVIEDDHVEQSRRRVPLVESAHVEARRIRPALHELMHRVLVPVEGEDHGAIAREELHESSVGQAVRGGRGREERHEVDHVHDADARLRHELATLGYRRDRPQRRRVAGARQHDGWFIAARAARPLPKRRAARRVLDRFLDREPRGLRLLGR